MIRHFQKLQTIGLPKPIKVAKNRQKFHDMVTRSVEVVKIGLHLERAILPVLPQNIASKPKPEKEKIISKQKTRFKYLVTSLIP